MRMWFDIKKVVNYTTILACFCLVYAPLGYSKSSADEKIVFECQDFATKIKTCEPYLCEMTLAGVMSTAQIMGKKENRCVVATTVGVPRQAMHKKKSSHSITNKIPVTTICEYDRLGIERLSAKFEAMRHGKYNFSSKDTHVGEYNCKTAAAGQVFPTPVESSRKQNLSKGQKVVAKESQKKTSP